MKVGVLGLMAGALAFGGCIAPVRLPEVSANVVVPTDVRQRVLPSGLRVVHESVPGSDLAGVVLLIDAGAVHEPAEKEGLAHWVEHLAFRSRHREGASIERRLTASIAHWNGFTSRDEVGYYAFAAKAELPELLSCAID